MIAFTNIVKPGIGVTICAVLARAYYCYLKKIQDEEDEQVKKELLEEWNMSIFFPSTIPISDPLSSYNRFLTCFRSARVSIDICVMVINWADVTDILAMKSQQHVRIRIFTRADIANNLRMRFGSLVRNGVEVRGKDHEYATHMHHKFALIDDFAVMTGSLNWTLSSIRNRENVLVSTNPVFVAKYKQEFEKLWEDN